MLIMLAAPLLVLVSVALPAPLSRFVGISILAVIFGLTWRAAIIGGIDVALMLAGVALARRSGVAKLIAAICAKRVAAAFMAFLATEFGVIALLTANITGDPTFALPFDLGLFLSGLAFAVFMGRGRERDFTRENAGNFGTASSLASLIRA